MRGTFRLKTRKSKWRANWAKQFCTLLLFASQSYFCGAQGIFVFFQPGRQNSQSLTPVHASHVLCLTLVSLAYISQILALQAVIKKSSTATCRIRVNKAQQNAAKRGSALDRLYLPDTDPFKYESIDHETYPWDISPSIRKRLPEPLKRCLMRSPPSC